MINYASLFAEASVPNSPQFIPPTAFESINQQPNQGSSYMMSPVARSGPTFRLRGRIEVDSIESSQNAANAATYGNLNDVVGLRRARIGAEGNFTPDSRYIGEIDLASGQVVIKDLFVGLGNVSQSGEFKIGHMREPFSLEGAISSNTFAFMERSPISTLDPARNWGIGFVRYSPQDDSTFQCGVFKSGVDANDFQLGRGSDIAATAKWTRLLWYDEVGDRLMHVGFATSSRFPDNGIVTVNQTPRSSLLEFSDSTDSPFVPKLLIPANFEQLFNAQCAVANGPIWAQAEFDGTLIDQRAGPSIFYHGGYVSAGYFLTGEHRSYLKQSGYFGTTKVNRPCINGFSSHEESRPRGHGAWELVARGSYLDFSDLNTKTTQATFVGTRLPGLTLGVNWYLADRLRIMLNYDYFVPDSTSSGPSTASIFATRIAMFW